MKRLALTLVLMAALAGGLVLALPQDSPVGAETFCNHSVGDGQTHATIQAAIAVASDGETICVAAGTYVETGQIVIDKNLSIVGADKETTIIKPAGDTGSTGDARGWFLVQAGKEFNLSNVTLDGEGKKIHQAIRSLGRGTIENNIIKNIRYANYTGLGVVVMGDDSMTVKDNTFSQIERIGMMAFGVGVTDAKFIGNTYTGKGAGDWLDYGVEIGGGAKATIQGNTISNSTGVASTDGSSSAAILVTTFYGAGSEATITGNTLTDNTTGIYVGFNADDTSVVVAQRNKISGNISYGVRNRSDTKTVDASLNWWGTMDPVAVSVSGGVDFTPMIASGTDTSTDPGFQPDLSELIVHALGEQVGTKGRIQEGIDEVAGSTVRVAAGTYSESKGGWRDIELFKSLSLIGAGSGQTVVQFTGKQHGLAIQPDADGNVLVQGITFTKQDEATKSADWAIIVGETGGTFNNLIFRDVEVAWGQARNLALLDATYQSILVENCNIHHAGAWGLSVRGTITNMAVTDSNFDHNGWHQPSHGIGFDVDMPTIVNHLTVTRGSFSHNTSKGINLTKTSNATFSGITANNNGGAPAGGFGVSLWEWSGESRNLTFIDPTLTNNTTDGFLIGSETGKVVSGVTISGGVISGNGRGGLFIYRASDWGEGVIENVVIENAMITGNGSGVMVIMPYETVAASPNWWGSACGPSGVGPGNGDAVSASVDYSPWYADAAMTTTASEGAGGSLIIPAGASTADVQAVMNCAAPGQTVTFEDGTYPGGIVITSPGITIDLNGATVGPGSPAFTIQAADVTIQGPGVIDGDPTDSGTNSASPGILVDDGGHNFTLKDVEVRRWADGVQAAASVTSLKLFDNFIHSNTDAGLQVDSGVTLGGVVSIQGNLFKENGGPGIRHDGTGTLPAEYNSWGHIAGPTAGDGLAGDVDADPWTFAEVFLDMAPDTLDTLRNVAESQSFDVALKVDAAKLLGLTFQFTWDTDLLTLNSTTWGPAFVDKCVVVGTPPAGTVHYRCTLTSEYDADAGTVATFNFTANGSGLTGNGPWTALFDISHDVADTSAGAMGGAKVFVNNAGYGAPSASERDITDLNDGQVNITGIAQFTGFIDLQGRPNDAGAVVEVYDQATKAGATLLATATSASSGAYTTSYATGELLTVGSTYWLIADAYLFLPTTPISGADLLNSANLENRPLTELLMVRLLGGDATNSKDVGITDLSCIGGHYALTPATCGTDGWADVNGDGVVDILDLVLAAGNYLLDTSPWTQSAP